MMGSRGWPASRGARGVVRAVEPGDRRSAPRLAPAARPVVSAPSTDGSEAEIQDTKFGWRRIVGMAVGAAAGAPIVGGGAGPTAAATDRPDPPNGTTGPGQLRTAANRAFQCPKKRRERTVGNPSRPPRAGMVWRVRIWSERYGAPRSCSRTRPARPLAIGNMRGPRFAVSRVEGHLRCWGDTPTASLGSSAGRAAHS
jgi:hypothetical protein